MTNTTILPLENAYKTVLTASVDNAVVTLVVDIAPSITVPAGKKIPAVIDPKNNFREVVFITAIVGSTLTVERGGADYDGGPSTANAHSAGATIVITNPFNIFKDFSDAIDSKLDSDGGNPTTTWDLDVTGSDFRFRLDAGDMKFRDDNQAEVTLSALAAAAGIDDKAKVTAADTTSKYLDDAITISSGAGATVVKSVVNPGGNETLNIDVALDALGAGVVDHEVYTPAFLTGGNAPETVVAIWDSVADGEFQITIDGVTRNVAGLNFQAPAVLSMADVAAVIQVGIRALTTSTETCTWSGVAFVITSANTTVTSTITITSTVAVPAGTDISGAGAGAYMDCDAGSTAVVTAAVLDPTADAGKLVVLAASGNIDGALVDANTLGLSAKGGLASASNATDKIQLVVGSDGDVLTADSGQPSGLAWDSPVHQFVGPGPALTPKNITYQLSTGATWGQNTLSAFEQEGGAIAATSGVATGAFSTLLGPTLAGSTTSKFTRWNDPFTKITVDWWMVYNSTGTGGGQYGIAADPFDGFNNANPVEAGAYFHLTGGTILSVDTQDGAAGTNTVIVPVFDREELNNYRMELSQADCKFYLNGVLMATHTTNLPGTSVGVIYFGGGLQNGAGADRCIMSGITCILEF